MARDREKRRAAKRRYYARNRERILEENRLWRKRNNYRPPSRNNTSYRELRRAALEELGAACQQCGFDDHRALHIDHVEGDGLQRDGRNRAGVTAARIRNNPGVYQILCANCHAIKTAENREYLAISQRPGNSQENPQQTLDFGGPERESVCEGGIHE